MTWSRPRLALSLLLGAWGLALARDPGGWSALDNVNLPIHETGHLVFAPFGAHLAAFGGTLFQFLVPLVFAGYFWRRGDRHAATVPLWWAGQNCFNVARYVSDARAQELPLVGGGEHDWAFLLAEWDVLHRDLAIGRTVHQVGALVTLAAALLGVWLARRPAPGADAGA